jgi:competence protein ComGC
VVITKGLALVVEVLRRTTAWTTVIMMIVMATIVVLMIVAPTALIMLITVIGVQQRTGTNDHHDPQTCN